MRTRGPTRLVPSGTLTPHGYLAAPNMLCMEDRALQDAHAELLYASWRPHWPPHGRSARHTQHRDKHALTRSKTPSIIHSSLPHENGPLHPRIGRQISTPTPNGWPHSCLACSSRLTMRARREERGGCRRRRGEARGHHKLRTISTFGLCSDLRSRPPLCTALRRLSGSSSSSLAIRRSHGVVMQTARDSRVTRVKGD